MHYDWSAGHFWKVSHWPTRPGHNRNVIVCMSMQQILIAISLVFNSCSSSRSNSFKSDTGNPNPDDAIDYDRELITVGWVDILLGFAGADSFFKVGTNQDLTVEQQTCGGVTLGPAFPESATAFHKLGLRREWRECRRRNVHKRNVHKRKSLHICCLQKDLYFRKEVATSDHLTEAVWSEVFKISFYI